MTAKVVAGRLLFPTDDDRDTYLFLLGSVTTRRAWSVVSYCLMDNHIHLLVRTPEADLGAGIKEIHKAYAIHVNQQDAEDGHLFRECFHNTLVENPRHGGHAVRYIAHNPVKAGLCAAPADWPWSAHRALIGAVPAPRWLDASATYAMFGPDGESGRATYERVVASEQFDPAVIAMTYAARANDDRWLVEAVDELDLSAGQLIEILGCSRATFYRRLRLAREPRETDVPGRSVSRGRS